MSNGVICVQTNFNSIFYFYAGVNPITIDNSTDIQKTGTNNAKYSKVEATLSFNLNLAALSKIATTSNSILAMWALQPSIIELLAVQFNLADENLWSLDLEDHNTAALKLLSKHCMCNNNFISSSSLLKSNVSEVFSTLSIESNSPTSGHFELILKFLNKLAGTEMSTTKQLIYFDWLSSILSQVSPNLSLLAEQPIFLNIISITAQYAASATDETVLNLTADCLDYIQDIELLPTEQLTLIAQVCCLRMCSVNQTVRDKFSYIFGRLPLQVSLNEITEFSGVNLAQKNHISNLQHWHFTSAVNGSLKPQYFKEFIKQISFSKDSDCMEEFIKTIFLDCWYEDAGGLADAFQTMATTDIRPLITWIQWEAAQYCVDNKLRTTLGKPQDTFLRIEGVVKENARILSLKETNTTVRNLKTSLTNLKAARVLLGFLEALEKSIHNAVDGTAFALPPFEKPAKTFFRLNAPTCNEWFNRIRTAVDLVALHTMEAEQVIRYSEAVLKELVLTRRFNEPIFEHTTMSLCWALMRNGEASAIYGVYMWVKKITGRKMSWVKMLAELASGHRDTAIEGYLKILNDAEMDEDSNLDQYIRDFIVDMVNMALLFTGRWDELLEFLKKEEARTIPRASIPIITITSKQVEGMVKYDETYDARTVDLSSWEMMEQEPDINCNYSCHKLISLTENSLCNYMMGKRKFLY